MSQAFCRGSMVAKNQVWKDGYLGLSWRELRLCHPLLRYRDELADTQSLQLYLRQFPPTAEYSKDYSLSGVFLSWHTHWERWKLWDILEVVPWPLMTGGNWCFSRRHLQQQHQSKLLMSTFCRGQMILSQDLFILSVQSRKGVVSCHLTMP